MAMRIKESRAYCNSSDECKSLNKTKIDRLVVAHSHVRSEQPYSGNKTVGKRNELEKRKRCGKVQSSSSERHEVGVRDLRAQEDQQSKGIGLKGQGCKRNLW